MKTLKLNLSNKKIAACLAALALLLTRFAEPSAFAATYHWDTDGTTSGFGNNAGVWGTDAFWSTNATGGDSTIFNSLTTAGDSVNFGTATLALNPSAASVGVLGTVHVNRINFGAAQSTNVPVVLTGGTIALWGGTPHIAPNSTNATINSALLLNTNVQFNTPSGGAGGIIMTLNLNGAISGPFNVTYSGAGGNNNYGTILLGAPSTYAGNTLLNCTGTGANLWLKLGAENALPTTTVLTLDGQNGSGTAAGRFVRLDLNGFNQTLAGLATVTRAARRDQCIVNSTTAAAATLTVNNSADFTYAGQLGTGGNGFTSGPNFGLTKSGPGKLTLNPANTNGSGAIINLQYTGPTTVNGGIIEIGSRGRLGNGNYAADIAIASGAALVFTSTNITTLSGRLSGSGSLTNSGTGTVNITGTNELANTIAGPGSTIAISGGFINLLTVSDGGQVSLPDAGAGTVTNLTFDSTGSLSFNVASGGLLTVAAAKGVTNQGPAGSITITITGPAPADGTYTLIAYSGSLQGSGFNAYQLGATPLGKAYTLVDSGSAVQLVVATPVVWTGAQSSEWSTNLIGGFFNWTYLGSPVDFANGSGVLFDDFLTGGGTVDVSVADVTPTTVTFNNNTVPYMLQGSRAIAGSASLSKSGAATLTVLNSNSYTGPTIISAGTVQVGNGGTSGALGSGAIVANGSLEFNRSDALTLASPISGTGSLTQNGSGTLTLSGVNTYGGATLINAGALRLGSANILPDGSGKTGVTVNGLLDLNSFSETINGLGGSGTVDTVAGGAPMLTVGGNSASSTFSGVIQNTAGTLTLAKIGSGTLTLSGTNTYGGGTILGGGLITAGNDAALGPGPATFNGGARLVVGAGVTLANPIIIGTNSGVTGRGLIEPASAAIATVSGPITIHSNAAAGGHFATSGTGALLDVAGPITSAVPVAVRVGTVRFSGGGAGYTNLTLNAGTAIVGTNNGIATNAIFSFLNAGAGTLDLNGCNQSLAGITKGTQTATIGNSSTTSDSTLATTETSTFGGTIQDVLGGGTMKVNLAVNGGAFTLTGTNTYSGTTTISNGTLLVNGSIGASAVTVNGGGTLGGTGMVGGLVLVAGGGTLSPGVGTNASRLAVAQLTLQPGAAVAIKLNGTNSGAYDQITPTWNSSLGWGDATLAITLGYTPAIGDQYSIIKPDPTITLDGFFAGLLPDAIFVAGGYRFQIQYWVGDGNDVILTCLGAVATAPTIVNQGPLNGTAFPLTFSGASGQSYSVLTTTNISQPITNWTILTTGTFGPSPVTYTDTGATNQQRFYIIKAP